MLWLIGILVYVAVLLLSIAGNVNACAGEFNLQTSADWVKVIFWPITVVVYILGIVIWLLIWIPRKLFKGILFCFNDIKDFFIDVFSSALGGED